MHVVELILLLLIIIINIKYIYCRPIRHNNNIIINDFHRPKYHFVPSPNSWMNDPNGPFYDPIHKKYHLFFQYGTPRVWGHAYSEDMIHWKNLPIALYNNSPYDNGGVYSGSVTIVNNNPIILYSVSTNDQIAMAIPYNRSDPLLIKWKKVDYNPIIGPKNYGIFGRDPTTAIYQSNYKRWYFAYEAIPYSTDYYGGAILYSTNDWKEFKLEHYLYISNTSGSWECPDLFSIKSEVSSISHILKVSAKGKDWALLGRFDEQNIKFHCLSGNFVDDIHLIDSCQYYASKSFSAPNERQIIYGWVNEQRPLPSNQCATLDSCWAGVQAIPREMNVIHTSKGPKLRTVPIKELESLKIGKPIIFKNIQVNPNTQYLLNNNASGSQVEILAEISTTANIKSFNCGLLILANQDLNEYTRVGINNDEGAYIDNTNASLSNYVEKVKCSRTIISNNDSKYNVQILVDHSIIEAFFNNGTSVITSRAYPEYASSIHIGVYNLNEINSCIITSLTITQLTAI